MDKCLFMCFLLALLGGTYGSSIAQEKMDLPNEQLDHYEKQVSLDLEALGLNLTEQIRVLKEELDISMGEKVTQALDKILSSEVYRDIIRSKVASDVTDLRHSHDQLNETVYKMKSSISELERENRRLRNVLEKEPTCQCMTGEAPKPTQSSNHSAVTTRQPRLTTPAPDERNNIFIMPVFNSSKHHPRLFNIHSNAVSVYPHLNLKYVTTVMYISKLDSLFIGLWRPNKIISSKLNSSSVKTIKDNVWTYSMAVDEKISTVFLITEEPTKAISRMRFDGGEYSTILNLSGYKIPPFSLVVDTNTQTIYTCNAYNLLSVRYNGSGLTTLDTGNHINAVTLDIINGDLYYSKDLKLMKHYVSTNESTEVAELIDWTWSMVYYRDVVYCIGRTFGTLRSVDVGQNNVVNTLPYTSVSNNDLYSISLIP